MAISFGSDQRGHVPNGNYIWAPCDGHQPLLGVKTRSVPKGTTTIAQAGPAEQSI